MERYELPEGWKWIQIGNERYFELIMGQSPPSKTYNLEGIGLPFFQGKAEFGEIHPVANKYCSIPNRIAQRNDVLISVRAPVGPTNLADRECCIGRGLAAIKCKNGVLPRYLLYSLRNTEGDIAGLVQDQGGGFTAIKRNQLAAIEIPIPPLAEQKRIVARIEELTRRMEEIRRFRRESATEAARFMQERINKLLSGLTRNFLPLRRFLRGKPRNGWSPPGNSFALHGMPVLTLSAVTGFKYDGSRIKWTSSPTRRDAHYWLKPGELLITRSNTRELVGHAAIYDGNPEPCICPDLIMKMTIDPAQADTRFIHFWLQTHMARNYLMTQAHGTSGSMKKINQGHVENIPIPAVPVEKQRQVVENLCAFQAKAEDLKRLQAETEAEIAAFTPALLAKAFRGEL